MLRATVRPTMLRLIAFISCFAAAVLPARAVVVAISNDPLYTQVPASDDFGFANVGIVNNFVAGIPSSGVYLGDRWVISAYHNVSDGASGFAFTGVSFGGIGYSVDATTARRLHNPAPDGSLADLAMFRLTEEPPLLGASLSGTSPVGSNAPARMMGIGQDREVDETRWDSSWNEVLLGGTFRGYELIGARTMRWGTNTIESNPLQSVGIGAQYGTVQAFRLDFDRVEGEGMATGGDSGGGIFVKNGGAWELAGVMVAAGGFNGQPAGTVAYGNVTFAADIATYRGEIENIMATVPEPSAAALLLSSLIFLPRRRSPQERRPRYFPRISVAAGRIASAHR